MEDIFIAERHTFTDRVVSLLESSVTCLTDEERERLGTLQIDSRSLFDFGDWAMKYLAFIAKFLKEESVQLPIMLYNAAHAEDPSRHLKYSLHDARKDAISVRMRRMRALAVSLDRIRWYCKLSYRHFCNIKKLAEHGLDVPQNISINTSPCFHGLPRRARGGRGIRREKEREREREEDMDDGSSSFSFVMGSPPSDFHYLSSKVFEFAQKDKLYRKPPLRYLEIDEIIGRLWNDEDSLVKRILQLLHSTVNEETYEIFSKMVNEIGLIDESEEGLSFVRFKLVEFAQMVGSLKQTKVYRHMAVADILFLYAHTTRFFAPQSYPEVVSPYSEVGVTSNQRDIYQKPSSSRPMTRGMRRAVSDGRETPVRVTTRASSRRAKLQSNANAATKRQKSKSPSGNSGNPKISRASSDPLFARNTSTSLGRQTSFYDALSLSQLKEMPPKNSHLFRHMNLRKTISDKNCPSMLVKYRYPSSFLWMTLIGWFHSYDETVTSLSDGNEINRMVFGEYDENIPGKILLPDVESCYDKLCGGYYWDSHRTFIFESMKRKEAWRNPSLSRDMEKMGTSQHVPSFTFQAKLGIFGSPVFDTFLGIEKDITAITKAMKSGWIFPVTSSITTLNVGISG